MKRVYTSATIVFFAVSLIISCAKKNTPSTTAASNEPSIVSKNAINESDIAAGHQLYDQNCNKCHRLFSPDEFKEKRWDRILDEMAPKARLSDTEKQKVLAYVKANAKK